jgi:ubiquinone biosynthesis protein UbiJ
MTVINPTLHTGAVAALEAAANRALALDPLGTQRLEPLSGQVFRLECTSPELDIYLIPEAGKLRLMGFWDGDITTAIRGSAADFADLAGASDATAALINGSLELEGDSAPLIELQQIVSGLDLDWEAPLVEAFGDVAGHQLAEALRGVFSWGRQASSSISRQLEEFIHEEARLSPPRQEVEDFYSDLEQLNHRVDRLQARLHKLSEKIRNGAVK